MLLRFRATFHGKLLILFLLFSLLPLIFLSLVAYQAVGRMLETQTQELFRQTLALEEEMVIRFLEGQVSLIRSLAAQDILISQIDAYRTGAPVDSGAVFATLTSIRRENPFLEKVYILDEGGEVIISTATDEEGRLLSSRTYFLEPYTARAPYVGPVSKSSLGRQIVPVAAPIIRKQDNLVIGVLVFELNGAVFNTLVTPGAAPVQEDEGGVRTVMTDPDGYLVTRLPQAGIGERVNTSPIEACRKGRGGIEGVWTDHDGSPVVGVSDCLKYDDLALTMSIAQPTSHAFQATRQLGMVMAGLTLGLSLIVFMVVFRAARSVTVPIRTLQQAVRALGKGSFELPIAIRTNDELAELARDIDEMRIRLSTAREKEMRLTQLKADFISTAAHQLRTPLTAIKWSLEGLMPEAAALPPSSFTDLKRTLRTVGELVALVNDLLNVSRLEEGRMEFVREPTDIYLLVKEVAQSAWSRHREKSVELIVLPLNVPSPKISIDREKMQMALANLIDNAVKYTPDGGRVTVGCLVSPSSVVIEIKDTGIGIPQEDLDRLFSKFFRARNALNVETVGSGLGLYLTREIVQGHGGSISIHSTEGLGTEVRVQLPQKGADEPEGGAPSAK